MHVGHARGDLLRGLQLDAHRHQAAIPLRLMSLNAPPIKRLPSLSGEGECRQCGRGLDTHNSLEKLVQAGVLGKVGDQRVKASAAECNTGSARLSTHSVVAQHAQITRGNGPFVGLAAPVEAEQVLVLARPHKHRRLLQELPPLLGGFRRRRIHPRSQLEDRLSTKSSLRISQKRYL